MPTLVHQKPNLEIPTSFYEDVLLSSNPNECITGQLTDGVIGYQQQECYGLGFLSSRLGNCSAKAYVELFKSALLTYGIAPHPFHEVVSFVHDTDKCVQPGVVFLKLTNLKTSETLVTQVRGRVDTAAFKLNDDQKEGLALLEAEGFTISLHYIQNLIAIDLDLRDAQGGKMRLIDIKDHLVKGTTTSFMDSFLDKLSLDEFCSKHLYAIWNTEHGVRMVFRIKPIETHSTADTPFSPKIQKAMPTMTQSFYKGLALNHLKKVFGSEVIVQDELEFRDPIKVVLDWDVDTTSTSFGLARLPKIIKRAKDGHKVNLQKTDVFVMPTPEPIDLQTPAYQHLFYKDAPQTSSQTQHTKTYKSFSDGSEVVVDSIPKHFKSEEHKKAFVQGIIQCFKSHEMLMIYAKSPSMPYEAWFKILTSFRKLKQVLDGMGEYQVSASILDLALSWCRVTRGWDNASVSIASNIVLGDHEATFSTDTIQLAMGKSFFDWVNTDEWAKNLSRQYKGWANQSIFTNCFYKTRGQFKTHFKYDPMTGEDVSMTTSKASGQSSSKVDKKDTTPKFLDAALTTHILDSDALLPTVMKFSLAHNAFIIAPNFASVLRASLKGVVVQPITKIEAWRLLEDANLVTLKQYLSHTYQIRNQISDLAIKEFLLFLQEGTSGEYDSKYKLNIFFDALKARHQDYKRAKQVGESILGTTKYLDEWLPRMLHVDPKKSATHEKLFKLWGAYGRAFLVQLVQRAMVTNIPVSGENLLFLRGSSGAGKTMILKSVVASLFGQDAMSFAQVEDFIAVKSSVPTDADKDGISSLFGKLILLLDDMDSMLKRQDQGVFKAFQSTKSDNLRLPYAKLFTRCHRTFVTVATSNNLHILNDLTSSRRMMVVDIDSVSHETGNFVCDLLDKSTLIPTERKAGKDGPNGFVDLQSSRILQLAFGQAFAVGVLGEELCDRQAIDGTIIPFKATLMPYNPICSDIGLHDATRTILVEKPYLLQDDQKISDESALEFQISQIGVEENGHLFEKFLRVDDIGLGEKSSFEIHQVKDFFIEKKRQVPSDSTFALWASQGVKANDGRLYKCEKRRVMVGGKRKTVWFIVDEQGKTMPKNPFFVKGERGVGPWDKDSPLNRGSNSSGSSDWDREQRDQEGWGRKPTLSDDRW